ncbi:MAG: LysE family translocator [Casimicrobium sp.]
MNGITDLWALALATLVFLAIPGPGTIKLFASMAEKNGGARAGVWSTLGLMAGDTVWMVLALSGVAALAAAYPKAFDVLRYAGAVYLAWVGFNLIRQSRAALGEGKVNESIGRGGKEWFYESMLVSLSNPKVIGFYVAFFPLFIDTKNFQGVTTYATMIAIVLAICFLYCMWLIAVAQVAKRVFKRYPEAGVWLKRGAGAALIGFSIKFAVQK